MNRPTEDDLDTLEALLSLSCLTPWEQDFLSGLEEEEEEWSEAQCMKFDDIREKRDL